MAPGASGAIGERSVSIAGDVVGSLIVTGDNNNVNLLLGAREGALLEQLARRATPAKKLRPAPVPSVPPAFADSLDREGEVQAVLDALRRRTPVNLWGPRGIGKTYTLLAALNSERAVLAEGAVYLYAPGGLDDVLQLLFEGWYECEPPYKPSTPQLRRDLAEVGGLVALDSVELERDAAQQVLLAAARCRVVVSSRERVLMDGTSIVLQGLELEYAVQLLERELGRPIADAEREDANRICTALGGHPLKIREAVASARDAGRSLSHLAAELSAGDPEAAVSADKLRDAGEDGRRLLAALALFGDASVGKDHLRAIAGIEGFDETLMAALRRRDARAHSPRYNVGVTLAGAIPERDLALAGQRALSHFAAWAEENRARPPLLMSEASALLALMRWAVATGRFREAIKLGREVDHAFALARRFGAWEQCLKVVHAAALAAGDREAEAWALHQLGTRALCLGDVAAGSATLGEAMALRREIGDADGASQSARNLAVATRPRGLWPWIVGHSVLLGIVLVVVVVGAVAAVTLQSGNHPNQTVGTSVNNVSQPAGAAATQSGGSAAPQSGGSVVNPSSGGGQSGGSPITPTTPTTTTTATPPASLFVATQGVSVTSDPGGISCPETCSASFPAETKVNLTSSSPAFWVGAPDCAQAASQAGSSTCEITLDRDSKLEVMTATPPSSSQPPTTAPPPTSSPG